MSRKNGWDALTVAEILLCAIEELESEVSNGGFAQYSFNSAGDYWEDAQKGLAVIGAMERHQVMSATVKTFGDQCHRLIMISAPHSWRKIS